MQNFIQPVSSSANLSNNISPTSLQDDKDWAKDKGLKIEQGRSWVSRRWYKTAWDSGHSVMCHWGWEDVDTNSSTTAGYTASGASKAESIAQKVLGKQVRWVHRHPKRQVIFHMPLRHLTVSRLMLKRRIDNDSTFIHLTDDGWVQLQIKAEEVKDKEGKVLGTKKHLTLHGADDCDENTLAEVADKMIGYLMHSDPTATKIKIDNGSQAFRKAMEEALNRYNTAHNTTITLTEGSKAAPEAQKFGWWDRRIVNNYESLKHSKRQAISAIKSLDPRKLPSKVSETMKKSAEHRKHVKQLFVDHVI